MIDQLLKIFKSAADVFGFEEWFVNLIIFYLLLFGFVFFILQRIYKLLKQFWLWRNQRKLNRDLAYYSKNDVERTTKYFIPVKYQNVAPSIDDELGSSFIAVPKDKLIPLFLKKAFKNDRDDNKYYLILADSGMGKTTFMINLYIKYKNSWRFPWALPKYDIKLFPLGQSDILNEIEQIKNKKDTILLLDAFDEDLEAIKDYKKRMEEILLKVNKFREIVITCRTQFFPTKEEEPGGTGYYSFGEHGEYKFQKLYLSVFDEKDIKRYLRKRFSFFEFKKYKIAKQIADKSPTLVVRPMLLSHIEDLVKSDKNYEFSFQIYEELIDRWLEREAKKPKIKQLFKSEENAKKCLLSFSENLAVYLYENRKKHGGYFLPKGEKFDKELIETLNVPNVEIDFLENIAKGKSLLNRDAAGNYKFSHKSVLEYFLAKKFFDNPALYQYFNFQGMDATDNFFKEMMVDKLRNTDGGFYIYEGKQMMFKDIFTSSSKPQLFSEISFNDIFKANYLFIRKSSPITPLMFKIFSNLKFLNFSDNIYLRHVNTLYFTHIHQLACVLLATDSLQTIYETSKNTIEEQKSMYERSMELIEILKPQELLELQELKKLKEILEELQLKELLGLINFFEIEEYMEMRKAIQNIDKNTAINNYRKQLPIIHSKLAEEMHKFHWQNLKTFKEKEITQLLELRKLIAAGIDESFSNELIKVNQFVKEANLLEKYSQCEVRYY